MVLWHIEGAATVHITSSNYRQDKSVCITHARRRRECLEAEKRECLEMRIMGLD